MTPNLEEFAAQPNCHVCNERLYNSFHYPTMPTEDFLVLCPVLDPELASEYGHIALWTDTLNKAMVLSTITSKFDKSFCARGDSVTIAPLKENHGVNGPHSKFEIINDCASVTIKNSAGNTMSMSFKKYINTLKYIGINRYIKSVEELGNEKLTPSTIKKMTQRLRNLEAFI